MSVYVNFYLKISPCCPIANTMKTIAVIGTGIAGASTAYQIARIAHETNQPVEVLVLGRDSPNEFSGGSNGISRITRVTSYKNADIYPDFARRSNAANIELGALTPAPLVFMGNNRDYLQKVTAAALASNVPHEELSAINEDYPYIDFQGMSGIFEYAAQRDGQGAGIINPEHSAQTLLKKAQELGAAVRYQENVMSVRDTDRGQVELTLASGEILFADKAVVAMGAWTDLVIEDNPAAPYTRPKSGKLFWFKIAPSDEADKIMQDFPVIIQKLRGGPELAESRPDFAAKYPQFRDTNFTYGTYMMREITPDGAFIKAGVAVPNTNIKESPEKVLSDAWASFPEEKLLVDYYREFFPGLVGHMPDVLKHNKASRRSVGLYSYTKDTSPVISPIRPGSNVIAMYGFSGSGAKTMYANAEVAAHFALNMEDDIPEAIKAEFRADRDSLHREGPYHSPPEM